MVARTRWASACAGRIAFDRPVASALYSTPANKAAHDAAHAAGNLLTKQMFLK